MGAREDSDSSISLLPSTVNRLDAAFEEASVVEAFPLFSQSFFPSLLFSFSRSWLLSVSLSFSLGGCSLEAEAFRSLSPFPAPRPFSWGLGAKTGKSWEDEGVVEEEDDEAEAGFPAALLLGLEGKVLKGVEGKALLAETAATPGRELGLLQETEPGGNISDEPLSIIWPPGWLLRLVIEWDGECGWPRRVPRARLLLRLRPDEDWRGDSEPGLLTDDDCRVTDSKMREWASLGVKRGARSSGLRFWCGVS